MSQFSNQLLKSLEDCEFTQTFIQEQSGLSQGSVSRYANGEIRPDLEAFEKICGLFPKQHQTALLLAYLVDDVPDSLKNLVAIEPKSAAAARAAEDSPVYRSRMPKKLREAYDHLGAAALEHASIAKIIINTSDLQKGAA
jgi:transcriptional regulator with XRE-family HTH domain